MSSISNFDLETIERMERYVQSIKEFQNLLSAQDKFIEGSGELYKNLNSLILNYNSYLKMEFLDFDTPTLRKIKQVATYIEPIMRILFAIWPIYILIFSVIAFAIKSFKKSEEEQIKYKIDKGIKNFTKEVINKIKKNQGFSQEVKNPFSIRTKNLNAEGIKIKTKIISQKNGFEKKEIKSLSDYAEEIFKFKNNEKINDLLENKGFALLLQGASGTGKTYLVENQIPKYYKNSLILNINSADFFNKNKIYNKDKKPSLVESVQNYFLGKSRGGASNLNETKEYYNQSIDNIVKLLKSLDKEISEINQTKKPEDQTVMIVNFDEFEKIFDSNESLFIESQDFQRFCNDIISKFNNSENKENDKKSNIIISMTANKELQKTQFFQKINREETQNNVEESRKLYTMFQTRLQGNDFEFKNQSFYEIIDFARNKYFKVNDCDGSTNYTFDAKILDFLKDEIEKSYAFIQGLERIKEGNFKDFNKHLLIIRNIYLALFPEENQENFDVNQLIKKNEIESLKGKINKKFIELNGFIDKNDKINKIIENFSKQDEEFNNIQFTKEELEKIINDKVNEEFEKRSDKNQTFVKYIAWNREYLTEEIMKINKFAELSKTYGEIIEYIVKDYLKKHNGTELNGELKTIDHKVFCMRDFNIALQKIESELEPKRPPRSKGLFSFSLFFKNENTI
jgi:hypothetical protein